MRFLTAIISLTLLHAINTFTMGIGAALRNTPTPKLESQMGQI